MANNFTAEVADRLLDKLSSDDAFRDQFSNDPRAALASLGHVTPAEDVDKRGSDPINCCTMKGPLASKEKIAAARAVLKTQLTSRIFSFGLAALGSD